MRLALLTEAGCPPCAPTLPCAHASGMVRMLVSNHLPQPEPLSPTIRKPQSLPPATCPKPWNSCFTPPTLTYPLTRENLTSLARRSVRTSARSFFTACTCRLWPVAADTTCGTEEKRCAHHVGSGVESS